MPFVLAARCETARQLSGPKRKVILTGTCITNNSKRMGKGGGRERRQGDGVRGPKRGRKRACDSGHCNGDSYQRHFHFVTVDRSLSLSLSRSRSQSWCWSASPADRRLKLKMTKTAANGDCSVAACNN